MAHVNCPKCGERFKLPSIKEKQGVRCPACKHEFSVSPPSQPPPLPDSSDTTAAEAKPMALYDVHVTYQPDPAIPDVPTAPWRLSALARGVLVLSGLVSLILAFLVVWSVAKKDMPEDFVLLIIPLGAVGLLCFLSASGFMEMLVNAGRKRLNRPPDPKYARGQIKTGVGYDCAVFVFRGSLLPMAALRDTLLKCGWDGSGVCWRCEQNQGELDSALAAYVGTRHDTNPLRIPGSPNVTTSISAQCFIPRCSHCAEIEAARKLHLMGFNDQKPEHHPVAGQWCEAIQRAVQGDSQPLNELLSATSEQ